MAARSGVGRTVGARFIDKSRQRDPTRRASIAQARHAHVIVHHHPVAPPRAIYGIKFPEFLARAASLRRRPGYSSSVRRLSSGRESGLGENERESDIIDASAGCDYCMFSQWRGGERALAIPTKAVVGTDGEHDGDEKKRRKEEASSVEKGRGGGDRAAVLRSTSRGT